MLKYINKLIKGKNMTINKGKVVIIDYTLKNEEGTIIDSSKNKEPLGFIHGSGQVIVGLEQVLIGKSQGEKFTTVIMPEDAYGLKNEEYIQTVSMNQFKDKSQVKVGAQFQLDNPEQTVATIVDIKDYNVTLDLNHPLAGESLYFDIDIVEVRDATKSELDKTDCTSNKNANCDIIDCC